MNIALVPQGVRDLDSVLAFLMLAGVVVATCAALYFLGRHHHRERKAKRHARHDARGRPQSRSNNHGRH